MTTIVDLTNLDFENIKSNYIEYLKNQTTLTDYDYDGSAMQVILDMLAYNTYLQSFYYNMVANEAFLDTAVIRSSIVSKAKALGYTPRSRQSAMAKIFLTFNPTDNPLYVDIPIGTKFKTNLNGRDYIFTTAQEFIASFNSDTGYYERQIDIYEGQILTQKYLYNSINPARIYILDKNVDMSSLKVTVQPNPSSTAITEYTLAKGLTGVNSTSTVYWTQEDVNGLFEVYFGDGILGRALQNNEVVTLSYRTSVAELINGANSFSPVGYSGVNPSDGSILYQPITLDLIQPALYGAERESDQSIKFNAPKSYARQNRVVTVGDYESFLSENFPELESFSVWGGEENNPPIYGKVYMCAKPVGGYLLSAGRKQAIVDSLKNYNVMTMEPVVVDPLFTFINVDTTVYYNPALTTASADTVFGNVVTTIQNFEEVDMNQFKKTFYLSKLSTSLDNSDISIVNNSTSYRLEKRISPIYNSSITYKMDFHTQLNVIAGVPGCLSSYGFYVSGSADQMFLDDDGNGNIRMYSISNNIRNYVNNTAGTIDYTSGIITISSMIFSALPAGINELSVFVSPVSSYYNPIRNEILLFSYPRVTLFNTAQNVVQKIDTVDVLGNSASVSTSYLLNPVLV